MPSATALVRMCLRYVERVMQAYEHKNPVKPNYRRRIFYKKYDISCGSKHMHIVKNEDGSGKNVWGMKIFETLGFGRFCDRVLILSFQRILSTVLFVCN